MGIAVTVLSHSLSLSLSLSLSPTLPLSPSPSPSLSPPSFFDSVSNRLPYNWEWGWYWQSKVLSLWSAVLLLQYVFESIIPQHFKVFWFLDKPTNLVDTRSSRLSCLSWFTLGLERYQSHCSAYDSLILMIVGGYLWQSQLFEGALPLSVLSRLGFYLQSVKLHSFLFFFTCMVACILKGQAAHTKWLITTFDVLTSQN